MIIACSCSRSLHPTCIYIACWCRCVLYGESTDTPDLEGEFYLIVDPTVAFEASPGAILARELQTETAILKQHHYDTASVANVGVAGRPCSPGSGVRPSIPWVVPLSSRCRSGDEEHLGKCSSYVSSFRSAGAAIATIFNTSE